MAETEKERSNVKPTKAPFDESKLTPPQREALAIAKAQGVHPIRSLEDLFATADLGLSPEEGREFHDFLMEQRRLARAKPSKTYDFGEDGD